MQKKLYCKTFAIVIIVLFIGAGAISSAVEINSEVVPSEEYNEKISLIIGRGQKTYQWEPFEVHLKFGNLLIISYTTSGLYIKKATEVDINFFIGLAVHTGGFGSHIICGIAIGDINWE
jgi:hypothetical protein